MGPTASGKSEVALRLAEELGAPLLSVDSMQVYRGMDIGTAKPTPEERARVPHLMVDVAEPEERYTVARFREEARRALENTDGPVVVAGGSGLHFRAVVDPYRYEPTDPEVRTAIEATPVAVLRAELLAADPAAADHVDLANPRRVARAVEILRLTGRTPSARAAEPAAQKLRRYEAEIPFVAVGLDPGEGLEERIVRRLDAMRAAGLLEEVRRLADRLGPTARQAVGYKELLPVVRGEIDEETGFAAARAATTALAKRQRTFFRRDPRIRWVPWDADADRRLAAARAALGPMGR